MSEPQAPNSLFAKTRGPNAVSVSVLVNRAEKAVDDIKKDYLPYLRARLANLTALSAEASQTATEGNPWQELRLAMLDVRSSSATAGYDQLSAVANSLEWLLGEAPNRDPEIAEVVRLHLDAICRLIEDGAPHLGSPKVQELLTALGRVSDHVTRGC